MRRRKTLRRFFPFSDIEQAFLDFFPAFAYNGIRKIGRFILMRKIFTILTAILCCSLLLTGCNLRGMLGGNDQLPAETERPISTAIVITDGAILYDEPGGKQVGTLAQGVTVTFRDTQNSHDQMWVECITPVEYTWIALSDLQVTASGGSMSVVYGPDGAVSGGNVQVVVGPNGEMTVVRPGEDSGDISYVPGGTVDIPGTAVDAPEVTGTWEYFEVNDLALQEGHGGGYGITWVFCENGYAVLQSGDGAWSTDMGFSITHTSDRLYGKYEITGNTLTFTVTEDWYYTTGENLGKVMTYSIEKLGEAELMIDGDMFAHVVESSYMDIIRKANGGPTGNDATDLEWHSGNFTQGTEEMLGNWVCFEEQGTTYLRRMWIFEDANNCRYQAHTFEQVGGDWVIVPFSGCEEFYYDGYFLRDGDLYVVYGPDTLGPYKLSIQGDTMTVTFTDWNGVTESVTYKRTTDPDPGPR